MEEKHPQMIDHQFVVESLLAEGSFARVYRVKRGDETWALKLLKRAQRGQGEAWVEAFRFEFSLLKDLSHPAVVRIGDFGWDRDIEALYFTEELVNGMPLDEFLKSRDVRAGEALFIQCLEGLDAIHRAGALHGDIKPSNIYVVGPETGKAAGWQPRVKILDLGIAHPKFQLIAGTPSYYAPEKVLNETVDERADLYSLGVTFFECLTGRNPFTCDKVSDTLKAQVSVQPPAPGALNPAIPPYLNRILCRLLAKNPRDRYRTAGEVLTELDFEKGTVREGEGVVSQAGPILISEKWVGRDKTVSAVREWVEKKEGGLLFLLGESGIGKSRLLNEIRYELELKGIPVRSGCSSVDARMPPEMIFLVDMNRFEAEGLEPLSGTGFRAIVALLPSETEKAHEWAVEHSLPARTATLEPMTRDDVRLLISLSTRDENPPDLLIDSLYSETKGHPGTTVSLLLALCRAGKLVGPHGEWNLALFREGAVGYAALEMTPSERDQLLSRLGRDKPLERAELLIEAGDERLRLGRFDEADSLFREVEDLIRALPAGKDRLKLRIALLEKKGWKSIRQENFDQAKRELEMAMGLLEELEDPSGGGPSSVVSLRVRNFYAFVLLHGGEIDKAVEIFEQTEREWAALPTEEERRMVTNNDLPLALMQKRDYRRAADFLKGRLPFYEGLSDSALKNRCRYNLGECFLKMGDSARAIEHYKAVVAGARPARQWDLLLRAYNGLGNVYNLQKDVNATLENYQRALDLSRYLKDWGAASAVAQNMGVIQQELGQNEPAERNLKLSLKMLKQVAETNPHIRYLKARATLELGEIERQKKHFEAARDLFGQASHLVLHEKGLEEFVFWVLHSQAVLALDENRPEEFARLYPDLLHHAKTDDQKGRVELLRKRSPVDPTLSRFEPAKEPSFAEGSAEPSGEKRPEEAPLADRKSPVRAGTLPGLPEAIGRPTGATVHPMGVHPMGVRSAADPLSAVLRINILLGTERDLKTLLSLVLQYALSLSNAENGLVLLADEKGELAVKASRNIEVDDDLSQISQKTAQKVLESGRPLRSDNALTDPAFKNYRSVMLLGLKSVFCLPIRAGGAVIGVLYLTHRFQTALFNEETAGVLQVFADQAGLAIYNARLNSRIEEQNRQLAGRLSQAEEQIETFQTLLREKESNGGSPYPEIITRSPAMKKIFALLDRIAPTNLSVLVRGESGTGKELVARALHQNSPRAKQPFMAINCGALPANLIESELFGYKAGAFTGAVRDKPGLFEVAKGGTLFLDEIGELDVTLQSKFLRAVQEREIMRLGDTRPVPIDVRIVSASLKNLREEAARKKFREDLFYRLAEIEIDLPSLRERREDIPLLVHHFAEQFAREQGLEKTPAVAKELLRLFVEYSWPGNVRELGNRIRVACALSDGKVVRVADLPEADRRLLQGSNGDLSPPAPSFDKLRTGSYKGGETDIVPPLCPSTSLRMVSLSNHKGGAEGVEGVEGTTEFFKKLLQEQKTWRDIENIIFAKSLLGTDFDVPRAARALGIAQATLYNRLRRERFRARKGEFEALPFTLEEGVSLEKLKLEVFRLAYGLHEERPYHAARGLGVSPGMFYQWVDKKTG